MSDLERIIRQYQPTEAAVALVRDTKIALLAGISGAGKDYLVPGVVSHATNVVEHPRLVAERIERLARLVGPERVLASTDCGLGGRVHHQIAWSKLEALVQGARLASERF